MAVKGFDRFQEHFAGYTDAFILIGGAACDLWFTQRNLRFRSTTDLDMVLVLEALRPDFAARFWEFIRAGEYKYQKKQEGEPPTLYRFSEPAQPGFPEMLELLARKPENLPIPPGQHLVPIRQEEAPSLSAILLESPYADFLREQCRTEDGIQLASPEALTVLKAKAWLDLTRRREEGDLTNKSDDIKKHRNDIFRLSLIFKPAERLLLPEPLALDLNAFLDAFPPGHSEWQDIQNAIRPSAARRVTAAELLQAVRQQFRLAPTSSTNGDRE